MKPLGYYTEYNPAKPDATPLLHEIQEGFGSCLEKMDLRSKLFLRATLSAYQLGCYFAEMYKQPLNPKRLIQGCIESIDPDAWQELKPLTDWLVEFVVAEEEGKRQANFEGFIRFLSEAVNA